MTESERFRDLLRTEFSPICRLSCEQADELYRHYCLLVRWNRVLNLSSVLRVEEAVVRHYCESLFLGAHLPAAAGSVLDVGSGGGFPGIPVAVLRSEIAVTLAESHQRKAVFLREATRHLRNVAVAARRAEELAPFEWVISRAVRWERVLPLVRGGVALLLGSRDAPAVRSSGEVVWRDTIQLPWGRERVLLVGERAKTYH